MIYMLVDVEGACDGQPTYICPPVHEMATHHPQVTVWYSGVVVVKSILSQLKGTQRFGDRQK